jgi:hypothetical protein
MRNPSLDGRENPELFSEDLERQQEIASKKIVKN